MADHDLDENLKMILYKTVKAIHFEEIPLLIADEAAQWSFLQSVPSIMGGTVIYSSAADAATQVLKSVSRFDYLFLVLETSPSYELEQVLRYYLFSRRKYGGSDSLLDQKFIDHPIHGDHRLILIADRETVVALRRDLPLELLTLIALPTGE